MKLDNVAKECLVIGSISLVVSLLLSTIEVQEVLRILQSDYSHDIHSRYLEDHCFKLGAFVAAALVSILIIFGITKRRAILMVPWLLAAFGGAAFSAYYVLVNLIFLPYGHLEFLIYSILIIGGESIVLFPLCTFFAEIRRERGNKLKCLDKNKGLIVKI